MNSWVILSSTVNKNINLFIISYHCPMKRPGVSLLAKSIMVLKYHFSQKETQGLLWDMTDSRSRGGMCQMNPEHLNTAEIRGVCHRDSGPSLQRLPRNKQRSNDRSRKSRGIVCLPMTKRNITCILASRLTISLVKALDPAAKLQKIKETERHVNLNHNCAIHQIQTVGNLTGLGSSIDKL